MADQYSTQSQYAAAARVPLIKSPTARVPPPVRSSTMFPGLHTKPLFQVELPPDIHPLPDSVTPYFAYPFVLEPHILSVESSRRTSLANHTARRGRLLRAREDEKEQRRLEALRRVAPGYDGNAATALEPVRGAAPGAREPDKLAGDVMDHLVEHLEKMSYMPTQSTNDPLPQNH